MIFCLISCSNRLKDEVKYSTDYFEFENNYWVNLHHFLYQKADSSQLRKLQEDGLNFVEIGEAKSLIQLSNDEKATLELAVKYYKDSLITKNLRRDLNGLRVWFQEKRETEKITDITYGRKFTEVINEVSPVYEKYFWSLHKSHNISVLNKHIKVINEIEEEVIAKMEKFSLNKWPDSVKVRVDITAYASWAGAYTTSKPRHNIIISTIAPSNITSSFVETILHEGSHLLYLFEESPIRDKFYYKSEELGIEFPRNLWHANMFYLSGRATQDELSKFGIKHIILMDEKNIFSNYNTPKFRESSEKFYTGKINADSLVINILNEIKAAKNGYK
ncbi:hypothetical protein [Jejuia spongiicola]|uniref:Uncharacterized protein n=1 Tax=Jejuia spongiicola TaxID=2942207 RepID=A0ABT0QB43_9FLAO|nr:hypothetical protein [Jejuia spongiicola]MCL6294185.1 hypothetical protein [Jejuia spongiicola]